MGNKLRRQKPASHGKKVPYAILEVDKGSTPYAMEPEGGHDTPNTASTDVDSPDTSVQSRSPLSPR